MYAPFMSKEAIARKAQHLLAAFERRAGYRIVPPIPVEEILERTLNLTLRYTDLERLLGYPDVLGATYVEARLVCINERLFEQGSEGRLVFTCAHEAGHWVLHLPHATRPESDAPKGRGIVCRRKDARERIEWQADYFAACLLMPEKAVREAFERVCAPRPLVISHAKARAPKGTKLEEPFLEQWPFIAAAMCQAGGFSNVSLQAMIIRLQDLGLLVDRTGIGLHWKAFEAPVEEAVPAVGP